MDANNYVASNGDGTFTVVVNGQLIGSNYPGQDAAQWAYNNASTGGSGGNPPIGGNSPGGSTSGDISDLVRSIAASNDLDLSEKIRQFDELLKWQKEQFDKSYGLDKERLRLDYNKTVAQIQSNVLALAAQMKGPENYLSYLQFTGGGLDPFSQMVGGKASPAFSAPAGYSKVNNIQDLMKNLGIDMSYLNPIPPDASTILTDDQALDWIWQNRPDLKPFYDQNGWDTSTPDKQRAAVRNWIGAVDPQWKGKTPQQVAAELGYKAPTIQLQTATQTNATPPAPTSEAWTQMFTNQQPVQNLEGGSSMRTPFSYLGMGQGQAGGGVLTTPLPAPTYGGNGGAVGIGYEQPGNLSDWKQQLIDHGAGFIRPPSGDIPPDSSGDWEFVNFPDASLGNPQPGMFYAQVITPGWRNKRTGEVRRAGQSYPGLEPRPQPTLPPRFDGGPAKQPMMVPESSTVAATQPAPTGTPEDVGMPSNQGYQYRIGPGGLDAPNPPPGMDPGIWKALPDTAKILFLQRGYLAENPHQINPAVWNSWSDERKKFYLSMAEKGYTPSGAWTPEEYLRQIQASAPVGHAPRQVNFNWGGGQSLF